MEVKIGVQHSSREIVLDSLQSADEVSAAVSTAITKGGLLSLEDDRGRRIVVPGEKIAYVEIGAPATRKVGFAS